MEQLCISCGSWITAEGTELCEDCTYDLFLNQQREDELKRLQQEEQDRQRWEDEGGR